jgi:Phosphotransferase enzyme family
VFVKLSPFDAAQRVFVNEVGMGVAEARFYRDLAAEVPLRVPRPWFADFDGDDRYVMVLEDLESSGCRFPTRDDTDLDFRARDIVEQLARLHAQYWESDRFAAGGDLEWIAPKSTGRGDGGAQFVRMAVDAYADRLPEGFMPLAEFYLQRSRDVLPLYREGERTLVHGDPHLGNLFVDRTRTGFLDWAVLARAPGIRDVAYVLCNSIPTEIRRASERDLVARYCALLEGTGITLTLDDAWEQYRLFALYSWVSATCTVGMGSKWQPEHIGLGGTTRATIAATDLGTLDLLVARLGSGR